MQRPIAAVRDLRAGLNQDSLDGDIERVVVATPRATVQPLIHDRPRTGLEGKFSMPYAIATAILDDYPGFGSFSDEAVNREPAQALMTTVETDYGPGDPGRAGLLDGTVAISVRLANGRELQTELALPPGSPDRPPSAADLDRKLAACGPDVPGPAGRPDLAVGRLPPARHPARATPTGHRPTDLANRTDLATSTSPTATLTPPAPPPHRRRTARAADRRHRAALQPATAEHRRPRQPPAHRRPRRTPDRQPLITTTMPGVPRSMALCLPWAAKLHRSW